MRLARLLALALLAALFVYPLARLLMLPLFAGSDVSLCLPALANSVFFALLIGAIAAPLGALLAQALESLNGLAV